MILHMGGGGRQGMAMDIIGGTAQPAGVENRIWIDTETEIGTVTVDSAAPSTPAAGDVYIELDAASAAVVTLSSGTRIVMLPLGITYQYQSGEWVSIDAYAYLSGGWVDFSFEIPDGDTVTPVNDTATWLLCAGIYPTESGNPTLAQVVASATLCATLMGSANAVNYMIRSTTIQTAVLGSTTAIAALDNSVPYVNPQMTSATAPTGEVSASRYVSTYYPYLAFDSNNSTLWAPAAAGITVAGEYIQYTFSSPVWLYRIAIYPVQLDATGIVQVLIDGQWVTVSGTLTIPKNVTTTILLNPSAGVATAIRIITPAAGAVMHYGDIRVTGKTREVAA